MVQLEFLVVVEPRHEAPRVELLLESLRFVGLALVDLSELERVANRAEQVYLDESVVHPRLQELLESRSQKADDQIVDRSSADLLVDVLMDRGEPQEIQEGEYLKATALVVR